MDNIRSMSNFELRANLQMKNRQISQLRYQLDTVQKQNTMLKEWNYRWQKYRWNQELAKQCKNVEKEIRSLSYIQTRLLRYIAGMLHKKGIRHVRGISKELHIPLSTTSTNLSCLQRKGLLKSYYRGTKYKRYYALPESLLFLDK